jgi:hypothetical protein
MQEISTEHQEEGRRLNAENRARLVFEMGCRRYLADVGLLANLDKKHSVPIASYVLCSSVALPVKTIIVGERPYLTDIHPLVSSAMSYDPSKARPTPSTIGVASDLSSTLGYPHIEAERWFRDGWKHASSGTVIVNCTLFTHYSSSHSMNDTIPFQKWVRCMIECTVAMGSSKIDLICMGVPAQNVMDSALRSMGKARSAVAKKTYPNPAVWSRTYRCDAGSHAHTFGKKGTSKSILAAVLRSKDHTTLEYQDYVHQMSQRGAAQVPEVGRMLEKSRALVDEIEEAYREIEPDHKPLSLREAYTEFARAMIEYRDSVLYDIVASSLAASGDNSSKIGRNTEWGSKRQWKKATPSVGESSKMAAMSEDAEGIEQKFEEDHEHYEPVRQEPEPPKRKTKIVKRIVRQPRKPSAQAPGKFHSLPEGRNTEAGGKLSDADMSALRSALYYISERNTEPSTTLQADIASSMESLLAKTSIVGTIVDSAAKDATDVGKDASASLGLNDGVVSEDCILPVLLDKLTLA